MKVVMIENILIKVFENLIFMLQKNTVRIVFIFPFKSVEQIKL